MSLLQTATGQLKIRSFIVVGTEEDGYRGLLMASTIVTRFSISLDENTLENPEKHYESTSWLH